MTEEDIAQLLAGPKVSPIDWSNLDGYRDALETIYQRNVKEDAEFVRQHDALNTVYRSELGELGIDLANPQIAYVVGAVLAWSMIRASEEASISVPIFAEQTSAYIRQVFARFGLAWREAIRDNASIPPYTPVD